MLGIKIGHYKLIDVLGEGGMGIVYKALDLKLERYVAIKVLNNQALDNPQFVERFKQEAKNQAKLHHSNIVPVFGLTEENNTLGIVMEYVEGETLENLIENRGKINLIEALYILRQILAGASYAHNKGFVHRDLKPSNIIINKESVAKIMDFGISKSIYEAKGLTKTGTKLGTLLYMSPEQVKALEPTNQSDIYSIGITFYEMLNGKNPFDLSSEFEIMEAHLKKNPPRLSVMVPGVGNDVDTVIAKALNKSTKKRYQTCEDFLDDVNALIDKLHGKPVKARKTKTKARTEDASRNFIPLQSKTSKVRFFLFAFVFICMFLGLILFIYDAISGFWNKHPLPKDQTGIELNSYRLNPSFTEKTKWKVISAPTTESLNSIFFLDDSTGYACGINGTLIKSTDGGSSWINLIDTTSEFSKINYFSLHFTSRDRGILTGENGSIILIDDKNSKLEKIASPIAESLFDIWFMKDQKTGYIVGAGGTILLTTDSGSSWVQLTSPVRKLLYKIIFTDADNGFISGWDGTILKTTNRGQRWEILPPFSDKYIRAIAFVNSKTGIAVGGGGEIFRTANGGNDWELIQSGTISGLYSVSFFDQSNGIILGSRGEILVTQNSGKNWTQTSSGQHAALNSLSITPSGKVFIAGQNGLILSSN